MGLSVAFGVWVESVWSDCTTPTPAETIDPSCRKKKSRAESGTGETSGATTSDIHRERASSVGSRGGASGVRGLSTRRTGSARGSFGIEASPKCATRTPRLERSSATDAIEGPITVPVTGLPSESCPLYSKIAIERPHFSSLSSESVTLPRASALIRDRRPHIGNTTR
ncbi:MAG: hypothetical protein CNCCGFBP_02389 [Fimbriimonadaceae bacterium]|nr:hypothetical protein [Fimbriimonadaceae bacterium]